MNKLKLLIDLELQVTVESPKEFDEEDEGEEGELVEEPNDG